jgi:phage terminase small subunit
MRSGTPPGVGRKKKHQTGAGRKPKLAARPLKLTPKQALFVREYLIDLNATRAAIAAGYSQKTAEAAASRLLRNVKVRAEIDKQIAERSERLEISADRVLQELARLAFLDPRRFFDADGIARPITALDDDTARALAGMDVEELFEGRGDDRRQIGVVRKYKLADKKAALELLGKHLGLFVERLQIDRSPLWERFTPQEMDEYIQKGKLPFWARNQDNGTTIQ